MADDTAPSDDDIIDRIEEKIREHIDHAVANGTVRADLPVQAVVHPDGSITVFNRDDVDVEDDDTETLPPPELPEMYQDNGDRDSAVDDPTVTDHFASNWGF